MDLEKQLTRSIEQVRTRQEHRIQLKCRQCGKTVLIEKEVPFGKDRVLKRYTCGHSSFETIKPIDEIATSERDGVWNRLYPFQQLGVRFAETSNFKCLIADEMGLGKTIQSLATIRYNWETLTPLLIISQAGDIYRWEREIKEWLGDRYNGFANTPIIHRGGNNIIAPAFNIHIISMALLSSDTVLNSIKQYGFNAMIVDESHSFKNERSARTTALMTIAKVIPHKLFLSGTPILNRITEYFTTLNILRPEHFPSKWNLINKCAVSNGKVLNLLPEYRQAFFDKTSKYIIRRTKKEVGIQLPPFQRTFDTIDVLGKQEISKEDNDMLKEMGISPVKNLVHSYNKILDELEVIIHSKHRTTQTMGNIMGLMAQLRHITGLLKIKEMLKYTTEFLESSDDPHSKITIGVHHKLVMDYLRSALETEGYKVVCISDEDAKIKDEKERIFREDPEHRICIASILGAGQGRNLQFCSTAIVGERQWNPSKEHQFEGRFHRIKKNTDGSVRTVFEENENVQVTYLNARETIDEYFDELVKLKGQIVDSTIEHDFSVDQNFIYELAEAMIMKRLHYVGV